MHGTYLFAQGRDGLYIIDQHAAQERVKYEEYRESIGNVDQSQQQLLVPYIFDFQRMMPSVSRKNDTFGGSGRLSSRVRRKINLFYVNILSGWQRRRLSQASMKCVICYSWPRKFLSRNTEQSWLLWMSCKRSIKANHRIDDHSARQLLYQLSQCDIPITVPTDVLFWCILPSQIWKDVPTHSGNHTSLRELGKY